MSATQCKVCIETTELATSQRRAAHFSHVAMHVNSFFSQEKKKKKKKQTSKIEMALYGQEAGIEERTT